VDPRSDGQADEDPSCSVGDGIIEAKMERTLESFWEGVGNFFGGFGRGDRLGGAFVDGMAKPGADDQGDEHGGDETGHGQGGAEQWTGGEQCFEAEPGRGDE